jgi:hypothetical protein
VACPHTRTPANFCYSSSKMPGAESLLTLIDLTKDALSSHRARDKSRRRRAFVQSRANPGLGYHFRRGLTMNTTPRSIASIHPNLLAVQSSHPSHGTFPALPFTARSLQCHTARVLTFPHPQSHAHRSTGNTCRSANKLPASIYR